jgi:putative methionine-R-sulfoxide reductase with GAF domain
MDEMHGLIRRLEAIANGPEPRAERARKAATAIRDARAYRWVGIYDVGETEIGALAWTGDESPAFPRFPIDRGLNGEAVRTGRIVNVGDVANDPRYLTAFGSTKSEIIVPVLLTPDDRVRGTIDVESERANAFGPEDQAFLARCAESLGPLWQRR